MKRFETHAEAWSDTVGNGGFAYATNDGDFAVAANMGEVYWATSLGWKLLGPPPCPGCGADPSDPDDECGCPDDEGCYPDDDDFSHCRVERDMPSWDAGM